MPAAPVRHVLTLITALAVAILGSAVVPAAAAIASGSGQSGQHSAPGKSHGKKQGAAPDRPARSEHSRSPKSQKGDDSGRDGASSKPSRPSPSKPAGASDRGSRPSSAPAGDNARVPGNNGTVKIEDVEDYDGTPNNVPHVGCDFQVEWFGFDEGGDIVSDVEFLAHAPTGGQGPAPYAPENVDVGGDGQSGAGTESGWDGAQPYSLDFTGDPHPKHGYHVKLTTTTGYSQGSRVKHKVFWVDSCEETDEDEDEGEGSNDDTDVAGVQENRDDTEVAGVQLAVKAPVAQEAAPTSDVPTVVAAGIGGEVAALTRSAWPLALVLLGLVTVVAALHRRARA